MPCSPCARNPTPLRPGQTRVLREVIAAEGPVEIGGSRGTYYSYPPRRGACTPSQISRCVNQTLASVRGPVWPHTQAVVTNMCLVQSCASRPVRAGTLVDLAPRSGDADGFDGGSDDGFYTGYMNAF